MCLHIKEMAFGTQLRDIMTCDIAQVVVCGGAGGSFPEPKDRSSQLLCQRNCMIVEVIPEVYMFYIFSESSILLKLHEPRHLATAFLDQLYSKGLALQFHDSETFNPISCINLS